MEQSQIIISGVTGLQNRGVEALLSSILVGLRAHNLDGKITVLSSTPDYDKARLPSNIKVLKNGLHFARSGKHQLVRKIGKWIIPSLDSARETKKAVQACCHVVATGGDVFSSEYGAMPAHLNLLRFARQSRIPFSFLAHSIGPFRTEQEAIDWSSVARDAALITIRERLSYEYVTRELAIPKERVFHTADTAFLLPVPPPELEERLLKYYGLTGEPHVAIVPSRGLSRFANFDYAQHLQAWMRILRYIRSDLRMKVLLVPHVQGPKVGNDDRMMASELMRLMEWDNGVSIAAPDHTASEYKALISACAIVVTERMHAAIAALDTHVPPLVVGYSVKARGILEDTLGAEAGTALVQTEDLFVQGAIESKISALLKRRSDLSAVLESNLPGIRERARLNFSLLADELARAGSQRLDRVQG